jgi:hypothetical protein
MIGNSINDNLQMAVCETPNLKFYKFAWLPKVIKIFDLLKANIL